MSPEWTLIALLVVAVGLLLSMLRDANVDVGLERAERLRLQAKMADRFRAQRQLVAPWQTPAALPRPAELPEPLPLEVAGLVFSDPPVIDLAYDAAHTVEQPLPMRPDHAAYRPHWPGTKENAHAR